MGVALNEQGVSDTAFLALAEATLNDYVVAVSEVSTAMEEVASTLRERATLAGDLVVSAEFEETKRNNLKLWREAADSLDVVNRGLWRDMHSGKRVYEDVLSTLLRGAQILEASGITWTPETVRQFIEERARNLAQVYAGRIVAEAVDVKDLLVTSSSTDVGAP